MVFGYGFGGLPVQLGEERQAAQHLHHGRREGELQELLPISL